MNTNFHECRKWMAVLLLGLMASDAGAMGVIRAFTNAPPPSVTNEAPVPPPPVVVTNAQPTPIPATNAPAAAGAVLSIKGVAGRDLLFSFKGWEGWPISGESKPIVGKLMMQPDQMGKAVFVDSVSTGNIKGGRKTLDNAFGTGGHSLNVNKGERVRVWISGEGGRKSNVVEWTWPLPGT